MTSLATRLLGQPAAELAVAAREAPAPVGPPSVRTLLGELAGLIEPARLLRAAPWLATEPRGQDETVIDFPGWRAPEASNLALRTYLRWLGYRTEPWGLGTNVGSPARDVERIVARLRAADDPPVALVGWSLGGVVAREVARALPERVSCVVTFGSPIVGGPTYTAAARSFGPRECARAEALARRLDEERQIAVPVTAIYTRRDGIVDWRACIDRTSPRVDHVEVRSTHLGLGVDPDVWRAVARALAANHSG